MLSHIMFEIRYFFSSNSLWKKLFGERDGCFLCNKRFKKSELKYFGAGRDFHYLPLCRSCIATVKAMNVREYVAQARGAFIGDDRARTIALLTNLKEEIVLGVVGVADIREN